MEGEVGWEEQREGYFMTSLLFTCAISDCE